MSVLDKKLLRDIVATKWMLLAIVAIVAVGSGCLVGFQATYQNLAFARDDYYQRCHMADFWIDLKKAPVTAMDEIESIPGVARARGRIAEYVTVNLPGVEKPVSGLVISLPESREDIINNIFVTSGTYFTPERRDEVLVSKEFAIARGIKPGDDITLVMKGAERSLRVVGSAISSEFVYLIPPGSITPNPLEFGVFYVKRALAEDELNFSGAINSVVGILSPKARANPEPVLRELEDRLKPYGVFAATPLPKQISNLSLSAELQGLSTMALIMPLMFLSVSALALNVLMTRLAAQQRVIVGTLKALGYGNRAIFSHFVKVGLITGGAGALAGCALGYAISGGMVLLYRTFFTFPALNNHAYPKLMGFAALIALVFGALGTMRGVKHVADLNPAEAMRPPPPKKGGAIILERFPALWELCGFSWRTILRNIFRNKARSLIGVFAAAMGASIVVSTLGMVDSLKFMVEYEYSKTLLADFTLNFRSELDYGAVYESARLTGVVRVEPLFLTPCTFEKGTRRYKGQITGLTQNATLTVPYDLNGEPVAIPRQGLLMANRLAEKLGLAKGDMVRVVPTKGDQRPHLFKVAGFINSMFGLAAYADYEYLNASLGEEGDVSAVQLRTVQTPSQKRAFLKDLMRYPSLMNVEDASNQSAIMYQTFVEKMGGVAYPLIFFGAVIFFGSILNASLIAIIERQRDIATYRVLGYQTGEIGRMFLRENLLVNLTGLLLGLPLGWYLLKGMAALYTNDMYAMPAVMTGASWAWSVGLTLIFVFAAQIFVQRAVNKLDWLEALNIKE